MGKRLVTSDEGELKLRLNRLLNRFLVYAYIQAEGQKWIDVAMSGDDNKYLPTSQYIACYGAGTNN